jgi:hypothetical protein
MLLTVGQVAEASFVVEADSVTNPPTQLHIHLGGDSHYCLDDS